MHQMQVGMPSYCLALPISGRGTHPTKSYACANRMKISEEKQLAAGFAVNM